MSHKLSTAVFAQGWLDGQFESMIADASKSANEDPNRLLIATQMQEQWNVVSSAFDELVKENAEMERRLSSVKIALA
jgi:hypothetical protein